VVGPARRGAAGRAGRETAIVRSWSPGWPTWGPTSSRGGPALVDQRGLRSRWDAQLLGGPTRTWPAGSTHSLSTLQVVTTGRWRSW